MKGPKRANRWILWLFKSRKCSNFVIDSYLKDSAFTAVKREAMQSSKQGVWKGYHLSIEGIQKGYLFCEKWYINPLSPNSDLHQFSLNNIHMLPREMVMRVNKMVTKEKMLWSFIKLSQLILKGNVWRSVWRICKRISGLKGLKGKGLDLGGPPD